MNRRRFLKTSAGIFVPTAFGILPCRAQIGRTPAFKAAAAQRPAAASGPNTWYDLQPSPGDSNDATNSTTIFWISLTPTLGGSCTKLRVWCVSNALGNVKMGLWNNDKSFNTGASGTAAVSGSGQYIEVTLGTPVTVAGGTPYLIGWESDDSPNWGYQNTTGTLFYDNGGTFTYSNFGDGTSLPTPGSNVTSRKHCVGMFVA